MCSLSKSIKRHCFCSSIFLAVLTTLPSKILSLIDKSYYYIKICDSAIRLRAQNQGADVQIETLDKKNLNITQEYIKKSLEKAKDLLNEYKEFDSKNPRIEKIQLLIDEINNKIIPRQERRPS